MEAETLETPVERHELPEGWHWCTMDEVANVVGGATPKTSDPDNYEGGDVAWLTPADLSGYTEKYIAKGSRFITRKGLESCSTKLLPEGTVLFTSRAPIGYVAIASGEVCTNQGFKSFVLDTSQVTPDYVYWWLKGAKQMAEEVASGTTFLELSTAKAKKLPIPVAPLPEQRRIVSAIETQLGRLDAAVARLHAAKARLKRYKQAVLKAAVEGRLTEEWRADTRTELSSSAWRSQLLDVRQEHVVSERAAKSNASNYKVPIGVDDIDLWDDELSELPKGWTWATADEVTTMITDGEHATPPRTSEGVPLLSARNVQDGYLSLEEIDHVSEDTHERLCKRLRVQAGDVLLSCSGSVGRCCVAPEDSRFSLVRSVAVLRPVLGMGEYLSYAIRSPFVQQQINSRKTQTAQANIFQGKIKQLILPIPSIAEQDEIVRTIDRLFDAVNETESTLDAQLVQAGRLRQAVLKRAFEGRLG